MMNWEQQRDNNIAKRDLAMEEARLARMESAVKTGRTLDLPQATAAQIELFAVAPNHFDYVEKLLSDLPRKRQREHFRNVWLRAYRSVKDDGSISFSLGNKQARIANTTLRDVWKQFLSNIAFLFRGCLNANTILPTWPCKSLWIVKACIFIY